MLAFTPRLWYAESEARFGSQRTTAVAAVSAGKHTISRRGNAVPAVTADTTVQFKDNKAADLTAKIAGDLAGATLHLYTVDLGLSPGTDKAALVAAEAGYDGYAPIAVAGWEAVSVNTDGSVSTVATGVSHFVGPAAGSGPTAYGYFMLSAGGGTPLIGASRFQAPVPLTDAARFLDLVASFRLP